MRQGVAASLRLLVLALPPMKTDKIRAALCFVGAIAMMGALGAGCGSGDGSTAGAAGASNEGGDIGSPCELEAHCATGLICDIHGGRGSCQEAHDH